MGGEGCGEEWVNGWVGKGVGRNGLMGGWGRVWGGMG